VPLAQALRFDNARAALHAAKAPWLLAVAVVHGSIMTAGGKRWHGGSGSGRRHGVVYLLEMKQRCMKYLGAICEQQDITAEKANGEFFVEEPLNLVLLCESVCVSCLLSASTRKE